MIEITNLTNTFIDEDFIRSTCHRVLAGEGKRDGILSIVFEEKDGMKRLNNKYRGKNEATDVLSFGNDQKEEFITPPENPLLGDVVVCVPVIKDNAKKFGSTFERELSLSLIHGILHILGYDHEKSRKMAEEMKNKQEYYLSQVIIK